LPDRLEDNLSMAHPRLIEISDNRFLYRCDECGEEWPMMTKRESVDSTPPQHRCRREDVNQAAARAVREATEKV
jgi:hypothetical protein